MRGLISVISFLALAQFQADQARSQESFIDRERLALVSDAPCKDFFVVLDAAGVGALDDLPQASQMRQKIVAALSYIEGWNNASQGAITGEPMSPLFSYFFPEVNTLREACDRQPSVTVSSLLAFSSHVSRMQLICQLESAERIKELCAEFCEVCSTSCLEEDFNAICKR